VSATFYPPRLQAFRDEIIRAIPKVPNTRQAITDFHAQPTRRLILALLTWRMRLIPMKPRVIRVWSGGVKPWEFAAAKPKLVSFLSKVEAGRDLTPHMSELVKTKGVVLPGASPTTRGQDIDRVLIRDGLHHFHIGERGPGNPKGRSASLIFAEVLDKEFRIAALSDHRAFEIGTPEHMRFFEICQAYIAKDVPAGQAFMSRPVMASGHAWDVVAFSDRCEMEIERLAPCLDDPKFVARLYDEHPTDNSGKAFPRAAKPVLMWHFEDMQFGLLEKKTRVFFCIFPYFAR
jgi:hypothetical protein